MIILLNRFTNDVALLTAGMGDFLIASMFVARLAEPQWMTEARKQFAPKMTVKEGIAQIPVEGVIAYRPDVFEMAYYGIEDARNITSMIQEARVDQGVKAVQFNVDSPGGFANGGFEIADAVAALSRVKPTIAHIGGTGASLAYMIASQANHVMASRSAAVGSIGAYSTVVDRNRMNENAGIKVEVFTNGEADYKGMGLPGRPLEKMHRDHMQERIQSVFDEFKAQVRSARPGVPDSAMRGQVFTGREAMKYGLVDSEGDRYQATMWLKGKVS